MSFTNDTIVSRRRIASFAVLLGIVGIGLVLRLGYLQIVQHGAYLVQASNEHTRKYEIPAKRGELYVRDGDALAPVALNQTLKFVFADPRYVKDIPAAATKLASVLGGTAASYQKRMESAVEYAVISERVSAADAAKIQSLKIIGINDVDRDYRSYPEGELAAQVLGFVNADGKGQYGIEGYLNDALSGTNGQLAAKTDTRGVPIATADNVIKPPTNGESYVLSIDRNIQSMAEQELAAQITKVKAKSGSIVIMDPTTGSVKAMANFPTFDPNNFSKVTDYNVFTNQIVTSQFEPGSGVKAFTMAAGLDKGVITPDSTYDDPGSITVGDRTINNAAGDKPGKGKTMTVVLRDSLNTGVVFVLRALGGDQAKINLAGKRTLYDYFTKHFGFGVRTGIEQSSEAAGSILPPSTNDVTYANMSFGQGMSATMIQMVAAMSAVANGGKLYQPRVVDGVMKADGTITPTTPKLVADHVMNANAVRELNEMLQVVVQRGSGYSAALANPGYKIAGKTGTAQIAKSDGTGYIDGANIGSFIGYAPADNPRFVMMVRINEPSLTCNGSQCGYAEYTTVPVFAAVSKWLFKYYGIAPTS